MGRNEKRDTSKVRNTNKKQMSKRNSTKAQRRFKEVVDTEAAQLSTSNPYTWYANFPQYAKDVASLAFGVPVGQAVNVLNVKGEADAVSAAGVMAIYFTPGIGVSKDLTSPINRQSVRLYTYLRSIQRSAATYDSADLMMYMLGVDSLYTYWSYLRRAYGVAQLFTPTNKYYPKRLLQAMGVDPEIVNNLADFRAYINRFALNIGKFAMPKGFNLTERHRWMCEGLYLDSKTKKAQTYVFVPALLWQFDNTVSTGSQLSGVQLASFSSNPVFRTFAQLVSIGESLLQQFENDEDTMMISGDIYRAYQNSLYAVEETPDNYSVLPVYDETVLSQIENSVSVGRWVNKDNASSLEMPTITQNPSVNNGAIIFNGSVDMGHTTVTVGSNKGILNNYRAIATDLILNLHWDSPSPEQVMEATRLTAKTNASLGGYVNNQNETAQLLDAGSDIVNYYSIVVTNPDNPISVRFLNAFTNTVFVNASGAPATPASVELLAILQQFDWGPIFDIVEYSVDAEYDNQYALNLKQLAFDVDNFTCVTMQQLKYINEAALLSLLDMPTPAQK